MLEGQATLVSRSYLCRLGLAARTDRERLEWIEQARINALMGSCQRSTRSIQCGLKAYYAFAGIAFYCAGLGLCSSFIYDRKLRTGNKVVPAAETGGPVSLEHFVQDEGDVLQLYGVRQDWLYVGKGVPGSIQ